MNQPKLVDAILVVHSLLTQISDEDVEQALAPVIIGLGTTTVRLEDIKLRLDQLADLDWGVAYDVLAHEFDTKLDPVLRQCSGPIHYFGMLPIPFAIEIGRRIGPARKIIAYQQRHDTKSWRWPLNQMTVELQPIVRPSGICRAKGDVIVRVTCSHLVSAENTHQIVPDAMGEFHVEVKNPREDVLQSEADVSIIATAFGEILDDISQSFPNCKTIHLFTAAPPALALRLGAEINPTIHKPVQTYQFSHRRTPCYVPAVLVGLPSQPNRPYAQRMRTKQPTHEIRVYPMSIPTPAKILFLASNPATTERLALDEEARDIEAKIRAAEHRESLVLKTRWAVRADDLIQALNEDRPTIVHFSGHGAGRRGLALHDEAGQAKLVNTAAIKHLFETLKDNICIVVLNACYSEEQATAIATVVDCVIGMSDSIDDKAARKFAASFYRALGFGRSVKNAFNQGLTALKLEGLPDDRVPELLVRDGVNPDAVFVVSPP